MTSLSQETTDKAEALLPINLRYLFNEIDMYVDSSGEEFIYNNLVSTIFHRLGECSVQAEATNNIEVTVLLESTTMVMEDLREHFRFAIFDLVRCKDLIQQYVEAPSVGHTITMGEYKEAP